MTHATAPGWHYRLGSDFMSNPSLLPPTYATSHASLITHLPTETFHDAQLQSDQVCTVFNVNLHALSPTPLPHEITPCHPSMKWPPHLWMPLTPVPLIEGGTFMKRSGIGLSYLPPPGSLLDPLSLSETHLTPNLAMLYVFFCQSPDQTFVTFCQLLYILQ